MFAYLDNSATTKPCPEAVAAMVEALETGWATPAPCTALAWMRPGG